MRLRWLSISAAAAATLALAWLAVDGLRTAAHPRPNVIVLTMESARAEVMSPDVMPNVWRIAKSGIRFTQHRAVSGWTASNMISLLTGLSPFVHGVESRDQKVPAGWDLPLEDLARAGWRVAGLQPFMQIPGFQDLGLAVAPGADLFGWLARAARARRPFVLWYHYLDTHLPYDPPAPFRPDLDKLLAPGDAAARARIAKVATEPAIPAGSVAFRPSDRKAIHALYLGDFRAFDAWFARFWDFLEKSGLRENTMVVLTADHGEEMLERGNVGHASTSHAGQLHEEIVHLPLVVWPPRSAPRPGTPRVVTAMTDHLDIMPTIFDVLGETPRRAFAGRSLFDVPPRRVWRAVTSGAGFAEPAPFDIPRFVYAEIEWPWKLHLVRVRGANAGTELYDLARDPAERHDLAARHPDVVARLAADLRPSMLAMRRPAPPGRTAEAASAASRPRWVFPARSGAYHYDDLAGRFRLQWTGSAGRTYRVQYRAGSGLLQLSGEFDVEGTSRDFGKIDRDYWDTWLVPYGTFRLRVGVPGRDDRWSRWIELKALR